MCNKETQKRGSNYTQAATKEVVILELLYSFNQNAQLFSFYRSKNRTGRSIWY